MMDQKRFDAMMLRMKQTFIVNHFDRHDQLESLLQVLQRNERPVQTIRQVEDMLHKIAGSAGSVGFQDLGASASLVECFIRDRRNDGQLDARMVAVALDAFLDVSLTVCEEAGLHPSPTPARDDQDHPLPAALSR